MRGLGDAKNKLGPARKALLKMAKQSEPLPAPLPGPVRERQERKAGYETTKEDITKWQPLVKVGHLFPCTFRIVSHHLCSQHKGGNAMPGGCCVFVLHVLVL